MSSLPLDDLLGYLQRTRRTGRLTLSTSQGVATVEFHTGATARAKFGRARDREALCQLLSVDTGEFSFEEDTAIERPTGEELPAIEVLQLQTAVERDHSNLVRSRPEPPQRAATPQRAPRKRSVLLTVSVLLAVAVGAVVASLALRPASPDAPQVGTIEGPPSANPPAEGRTLEPRAARPVASPPAAIAGAAELRAAGLPESPPTATPSAAQAAGGAAAPGPGSSLMPQTAASDPPAGIETAASEAPSGANDRQDPGQPAARPVAVADPQPPPRAGPQQRPAETEARPPAAPPTPIAADATGDIEPRLNLPEVWVGEEVQAGPEVVMPALLAEIRPNLSRAGRSRLAGRGIRVEVLVSHTGEVLRVIPEPTHGLAERDLRRLTRAVELARFRPATKRGVPVTVQTSLLLVEN